MDINPITIDLTAPQAKVFRQAVGANALLASTIVSRPQTTTNLRLRLRTQGQTNQVVQKFETLSRRIKRSKQRTGPQMRMAYAFDGYVEAIQELAG